MLVREYLPDCHKVTFVESYRLQLVFYTLFVGVLILLLDRLNESGPIFVWPKATNIKTEKGKENKS